MSTVVRRHASQVRSGRYSLILFSCAVLFGFFSMRCIILFDVWYWYCFHLPEGFIGRACFVSPLDLSSSGSLPIFLVVPLQSLFLDLMCSGCFIVAFVVSGFNGGGSFGLRCHFFWFFLIFLVLLTAVLCRRDVVVSTEYWTIVPRCA